MRQRRKIGALGQLLSALAAWALIMPANIYGVLGCAAVAAAVCTVNYKYVKRHETVPAPHQKAVWWGVWPAVIFVEAIAVVKFCERWSFSGKVSALAERIGIPADALLLGTGIIGALAALPLLVFLAAKITRTAAEDERDTSRISGFDVLFCAVLALMIAMQFALAPGADGYPGSDSAVFLYIGEQMRGGAVCYRDLFDHKGLYLYFIEYAGLFISGGKFWGVWLFEVLNLFVTALALLGVTKLFTGKRGVQYASAALVLVTAGCYVTYEGGNLVEEYALFWISLALFIFMKYFKEGTYRFYEIVLLGITFAVTAFLRVNMIAVWAAFLPIVLLRLLGQKKWKDIGICTAGFLAGMAIGIAPVLLYCVKTASLSDMMWCYFRFNFGYSDSEGSLGAVAQTAWFLFRQTAVWAAVLLVSAKLFWKKKEFALNLWYVIITLLFASMSGRLYYHYGMILLPAMIVPVTQFFGQCGGFLAERKMPRILLAAAGVCVLAQACVNMQGSGNGEVAEISAYLADHTAEDANVLVIGNDCRYYLESGRSAQNRFFYQTPPINVSDEVYEAFLAELKAKPADVIILIGEKEKLLAGQNHLADVCEKLDNWCADGVYSWNERDSYGIYTKLQDTGE